LLRGYWEIAEGLIFGNRSSRCGAFATFCLVFETEDFFYKICEEVMRGWRRAILAPTPAKRRNLRMSARGALRRSKQISEQTNIKQTTHKKNLLLDRCVP
jgi:hypothetical protein